MIKNLAFNELISNLFSVISSSAFNIILIIVFIILGYLLISNKKYLSKYKNYIIGISIIIIISLLIVYNKGLLNTFDYLSNNLFGLLYFPNLFTYLLGLIILNIIVWRIFLRENEDNKLKIVSMIVYLLITYLSIILIGIVQKSNLNVFELDKVYTNDKALSIIRLTSIIFLIYLIFLLLYKIYLYYLDRRYIKVPEYSKISNKYSVKENKLPNYINEVEYPKMAYKETKEYIPTDELREFEKDLSIDDYKLLVKMLMDKKNKEEKKQKILFKDLNNIRVSNVKEGDNMLEKVEPILTTVPTIEDVIPVYNRELFTKDEEEKITKTVKEIDDNVYKAKTVKVVKYTKENSTLKQDKINELLRLYQN